MSYYTKSDAISALKQLNASIEAAQLPDGSLTDEFRATAKVALRDIFLNTSTDYVDGIQKGITVLYSGGVADTLKARQLALFVAETNSNVGIIDKTHVGELVETPEYNAVTAKLFSGDEQGLGSFMFASRGESSTPGAFDTLSERFARSATGEVISISSGASATRAPLSPSAMGSWRWSGRVPPVPRSSGPGRSIPAAEEAGASRSRGGRIIRTPIESFGPLTLRGLH